MITKFSMYNKYTDAKLTEMGKVFYSGKANEWQTKKYNLVRSMLLDDLRKVFPEAKDTGSATYLQAAIGAVLRKSIEEEKAVLARMRANAQNAHNNLLNYDLSAKQAERK